MGARGVGRIGVMPVRALRLAALRSNVWPLSRTYAALYRVAAWAVVRSMRARFPSALEAVFLRGSLAMGLLVPAVSDIDLFFVLRDGMTPEEHERLRVFYRRLASAFPILDPHPWMLRWFEVCKLYDENPSLRFRVLEGRQAFQCVYGCDRLAELPAPGPEATAVAQLFDLKSRLTYFNAFCLTTTFTDELEARRKEYLLFKLTLELARIALFLSTGVSISQRRAIVDRFLAGEVGRPDFLEVGNAPRLREFVAYTTRFRLRRSFCRACGVPLDVLEGTLLPLCLSLLDRFYARSDIRACPDVAAEYEHFYAGGIFLPTGHVVQEAPETALGDYARLKQRVLAGHGAGIDTVLHYRGLLVNLSNADARLGNCTVVALPERLP